MWSKGIDMINVPVFKNMILYYSVLLYAYKRYIKKGYVK